MVVIKVPTLADVPPATPAGAMTAIITYGEARQLREFLNLLIWKGDLGRPDWSHVKAALKREDRDMLRLVVIYYDGKPTKNDLAELKRDAGDKYPHALNLLRQYRLKLPPDAMNVTAAPPVPAISPPAAVRTAHPHADGASMVAAADVSKIPRDWKNLLHAFHCNDAAEAVIAGGALRDLFNERPIKDVDIFLKDRGNTRHNKNFLKKCFKEAGLKITGEAMEYESYLRMGKKFPKPKTLKFHNMRHMYTFGKDSNLQSWTIHAKNINKGGDSTNYNIIFVSDTRADARYFGWDLITVFDLGICQVMYDGSAVTMTSEYREDVASKTIHLAYAHDGTKDHLKRLAAKYPDWKLCEKSKKLLTASMN